MNETDKFKQFNQLYMLKNKELTHEQAVITGKLILDEVHEFLNEFFDNVTIDVDADGYCLVLVDREIENPNLNNAFKELEDIRYITGQQMTELGGDVAAIGNEVHQSNVSKQVDALYVAKELEVALERYPDAVDVTLDSETFVINCQKTGKVIKPTTYSPAVITDEMIGL